MSYEYGELGEGFGAYPGDFSGFAEETIPPNGQAGPITVVTPPPTFTQQLWSFLKSPLGWALLAGAIYFANREGYLDTLKKKAEGLLENPEEEE